MKKRVGSKSGTRKIGSVKETLAFRLLVVAIILLFILMVAWVFVYESAGIKDKGFGLGTLKWDLAEDDVKLVVLNYNISADNSSAEININWSYGNQTINKILIDFRGIPNYCNYTWSNDLVFGENKTYTITNDTTYCNESDFSNVTSIDAHAQIHVNLTQETIPIPDIRLYDGDSLTDVVDLDDYFSSLVNISYVAIESPDNSNLEMIINETTNKISFLLGSWYGTQGFNLTATSDDGEVLDTGTSGSNMSFRVIFLDESRPTNTEPEFLEDDCVLFEWVKGHDFIFDMDDCWDDEDDEDDLEYRYSDLDDYEDNITVTRLSGDRLKFVSNASFFGTTYFYIWANDSTEEVRSDKIYIKIVANTTTLTPTTPNIKTTNPSSSSVTDTDGIKTFSITAERYSLIKWYLNGVLISGSVGLSKSFDNLSEGDIVKVEILNGTRIDSKTWDIHVGSSSTTTNATTTTTSETSQVMDLNLGKVIFYLIVIVIIIIILLVIWIFISEKGKKHRAMNLGFGVVGGGKTGKKTPLNQFNIPGRG